MHSKSLIYTLAHAHLHTYTAQQTSRCPLMPVKLSFIHKENLSPSHFPTESHTPFPPDHWHLSPPILTHSFLLAKLCQTPAITTTLPTCLHGSDWQMLRWMLVSANSRSELGCHVPWDPAVARLTSWGWCWEAPVNAPQQAHTNAHTHSMGSFSSTKRMGSLLRLSVLLWCIIYVAIVWPSLETCWQRHYSGFWQIPIHSQAFNNTC